MKRGGRKGKSGEIFAELSQNERLRPLTVLPPQRLEHACLTPMIRSRTKTGGDVTLYTRARALREPLHPQQLMPDLESRVTIQYTQTE